MILIHVHTMLHGAFLAWLTAAKYMYQVCQVLLTKISNIWVPKTIIEHALRGIYNYHEFQYSEYMHVHVFGFCE